MNIKVKTSFICTVLNEEETIERFLNSLLRQTKSPDEVIIVDGGSTDTTKAKIGLFQIRHKEFPLKLVQKKGNRSVSRNFGIKHATFGIILLSDAGCILDKTWVAEIIKPFLISPVMVVAGYYKGKAISVFQKCLLPYVLVMPDRVNANNFLPSTRSMAMRKSVWKSAGGFPEDYSHNEDYVFAKKLKKFKVKIFFAKKAIVYWLPRSTLKNAFIMFFRFALGDTEAGIFRSKVIFIFLRYMVFAGTCVFVLDKHFVYIPFLVAIIALYLLWAVIKNYRYVKNIEAILFLPLLQITSDIAVLLGSSIGFFRFFSKNRPVISKL